MKSIPFCGSSVAKPCACCSPNTFFQATNLHRPTNTPAPAAARRGGGDAQPRCQPHAAALGVALLPLWATPLAHAAAASEAVSSSAAAVATAAAAHYVPSPLEVPPWEIWVGFVAGVVPFVIASYEFGKRILIQRRCPECEGRGLVQRGRALRKCTNCGGMLPWLSWKAFWAANLRPGNGGPLQQPRGQTSVLYTVPPSLKQQQEQAGARKSDSAPARSPPEK